MHRDAFDRKLVPNRCLIVTWPNYLEQHAPPRVRVFIDFLAETFGPKPVWEKKLKVKLS
ncbi:MAG: hypothetical protein ACREEP_20200 [Dongiaceae bacterium]